MSMVIKAGIKLSPPSGLSDMQITCTAGLKHGVDVKAEVVASEMQEKGFILYNE